MSWLAQAEHLSGGVSLPMKPACPQARHITG